MFDNLHVLVPIGTAVVGFLLAFGWNRFWRRKDDSEKSADDTVKAQGGRLIALDQRVSAVEIREGERREAIGRLEHAQSNLEGKIGGLQDFWRSEFGKLRQELREDQSAFRTELRADQANTEARLTTLLTEHQKRMHDRLNGIAADQARLLTQFVDDMADRKEK